MYKMDTKKLVGAFIMVVAICVLILSVVDVFNKVDYINEYNQCIEVAKETYPQNDLLNTCKESASQGLSLRVRTNQTYLSFSQYTAIYLIIIIKVLLAIVFLILGKIIFYDKEKINNIKRNNLTTKNKAVKITTKKTTKKTSKRKK